MANILFLDNIDSFTYNLVDQIRSHQHKVVIYRNDVTVSTLTQVILTMKNPIVILSPGSGHPKDAGCMPDLIKQLKGKVPMIGICLGHQALIESYGGKIHSATEIIHGKTSLIHHDNKNMFIDMPNPLSVARYHSLVCSVKGFPKMLTINAYFNNMVMAFRNNREGICGFQFHPESILTTEGSKLLEKTVVWAKLTTKSFLKNFN